MNDKVAIANPTFNELVEYCKEFINDQHCTLWSQSFWVRGDGNDLEEAAAWLAEQMIGVYGYVMRGLGDTAPSQEAGSRPRGRSSAPVREPRKRIPAAKPKPQNKRLPSGRGDVDGLRDQVAGTRRTRKPPGGSGSKRTGK